MDGKNYLYSLRQTLLEDDDSQFMDDFTSYGLLYEAAVTIALQLKSLRTTQTITTVADQADYTLNGDYAGLFLQNSSRNYYLVYNDGTNNTFITWKAYEEMILLDSQSSATIPSRFTVKDEGTIPTRLSSTTTAVGAASGGECTLTDATADFTDVWAGDYVHNTTDGSMGVILSKTSTTALVTALFNGTSNDWSNADSYVIQPATRYTLQFDPPTATASHTATLHYVMKPAPVFSDYGIYPFRSHMDSALVKYAAWLYKYRDRQPDYGDKWFVHYDNQMRKYGTTENRILRKKRFLVNLKSRR